MLRRFALLALFLVPRVASAACTGGSPTWATTIDQSSVSTCITNAANGDTINVSSGSATWSSITIPGTKGFTLACPSLSCAVTISSTAGAFTINTNSSVSFVLNGFNFTVGSTGGEGSIQLNLASGPPYNAAPRIYNNTFTLTGSATVLTLTGIGPGLIDHNSISVPSSGSAAETFHLNGAGSNATSQWTVDLVPGSANMMFLENNSWSIASPASNYCQVEEGDYGAIFVLRYNSWNGCQFDAHAGLGQGGTRWIEAYNNTYQNCCASGSDLDFRGGTGVFWGNTSTNPRNGTNTVFGPEGSDPTGSYPVTYQLGMGISGTHNSPLYVWGNSSIIQTSPTNNNTGMVQIGTAPVDATNCSGLTGLPANSCNVIITTSEPATLLRCESAADVTAGCPVSYTYSPYTYPHPMDNCPTNVFGPATCGVVSGSRRSFGWPK